MQVRSYFFRLAFVFLSLAVGSTGFSQPEEAIDGVVRLNASKDDQLATKLAVESLPMWHLSRRRINEQIYSRTVEQMLWVLDPQRLFFTAADVKQLRESAERNMSALKQGDPSFAFALANLWGQRVSQRLPLVIDLAGRVPTDSWPAVELRDGEFAADHRELHKRWVTAIQQESWLLRSSGVPDSEVRSKIIERRRRLLPTKDADYQLDVRALLLDSLARAYDDESRFLSETYLCYTNPRFQSPEVGIGVSLQWHRGSLVVGGVLRNGPADRGGELKAGDHILAFSPSAGDGPILPSQIASINGSLSFNGEEGSVITLTVLPAGKAIPQVYEVVRDETPLPEDVKSSIFTGDRQRELAEKKLGYVHIAEFSLELGNSLNSSTGTSDKVEAILNTFNDAGVSVVLLDLRGCDSGLPSQMLAVAGLLLGRRPVLIVREIGGKKTSYHPDGADVAWNGPLVVLTDRRTRECAEVLAGALQDYDRALHWVTLPSVMARYRLLYLSGMRRSSKSRGRILARSG